MCSKTLIRRLSTLEIRPKICVVGAGPAGFYAAQKMANTLKSAQVDLFERLPVPFGLVRFGVAPDHPNLKNCTNTFSKIAQMPNVCYRGNIHLGKDVSLEELKQAYNIVLLAYGVDDSKRIPVEGDNLGNIFNSKNFVGWYNGLPWDKDLAVDVTGTKATVFGHGNVAIDVARILLSPIDKLRKTDITEHALATLSNSKIKEVQMIGRRGPLQVSFTTKELRELLTFETVCPIWRPHDLENIPETIPQLVRPRKRLTELIVDTFQSNRSPTSEEKHLRMIFHRSARKFFGDPSGKIMGLKLGVNRLEGEDMLEQKAVATDTEELMATDMVVNCVGYRSVQVDKAIPFDEKSGVIITNRGKVCEWVYGAGWVAKGPDGVLMNTMQHAFAVAAVVIKDLEMGAGETKPGFPRIGEILEGRNVQVVTWSDWLKIDAFEKAEGAKVGKPREKIVDIEKMLEIAAM